MEAAVAEAIGSGVPGAGLFARIVRYVHATLVLKSVRLKAKLTSMLARPNIRAVKHVTLDVCTPEVCELEASPVVFVTRSVSRRDSFSVALQGSVN